MNRLTCTTCGSKIPNGQAVIRSSSFEQVTTHKPGECPTVPAQRSALSVRLEAARRAGTAA